MSTSFTSLLGFALPTSGELDGTWGDVVNASVTELVEDSIAGSVTASVTSADWTLSTTGSGAANQARSAILIPTGTPGVARSIFAPNSSKAYIIHNQSNATVTIKGSTGPTTGAVIAAGTTALVAWNGSDFVVVSQNLANAVGTLPVATGGTGQTTYTDGQLLIGNTSGNTLAKATLTAGTGVTVTNGAGAITIAAINNGTVTSVGGTGGYGGLTLTGTVTTSGNITLGGTPTGTWPVSVSGSAATFTSTSQNSQFNSIGVGTAGSGTAGEIRATNNVTAYYSDDRLKTKLGSIENALDKLCALSGFYYEANETAQRLGYDVKREVGVSAQEVQAVMPEIVAPAPIDDRYLTVRYERLAPLLIEAIKELRKELNELKTKGAV
jgi:hypothetical protein